MAVGPVGVHVGWVVAGALPGREQHGGHAPSSAVDETLAAVCEHGGGLRGKMPRHRDLFYTRHRLAYAAASITLAPRDRRGATRGSGRGFVRPNPLRILPPEPAEKTSDALDDPEAQRRRSSSVPWIQPSMKWFWTLTALAVGLAPFLEPRRPSSGQIHLQRHEEVREPGAGSRRRTVFTSESASWRGKRGEPTTFLAVPFKLFGVRPTTRRPERSGR